MLRCVEKELKKLRVILIDPPTPCNTNVPNVGIAYIGASLKQLGCEVSVVDMARNPKTKVSTLEDVDFIGLSVKSHNYVDAQKITTCLRQHSGYGKIKIVWGGPHVTLMKEKLITDNSNVDYFVTGEGEFFTEWIGDDKMCHMGYINDLDSLPFPDYRMFDSYNLILEAGRWPLITTRGCPYTCAFCAVGLISGRKVRQRSVENCMREVEYASDQGFRQIQILDDNFSFYLDRAKQFCEEIKKFHIPWNCPNGLRCDRFDEELARLMVDAGCYQVSFGVETAHPDVYKDIGKGETLEEIEFAVETAKKYGLQVNCYFIIGLPSSTFERDLESLKWAISHKVKADFNMLVPYPQTRIWNWVRDKLIVKEVWSGTHFGKMAYPTFETPEYPAEDMMDAFLIFNHVSGSGFTKEWYQSQGLSDVMQIDLMARAKRHLEPLKKAGVIR